MHYLRSGERSMRAEVGVVTPFLKHTPRMPQPTDNASTLLEGHHQHLGQWENVENTSIKLF